VGARQELEHVAAGAAGEVHRAGGGVDEIVVAGAGSHRREGLPETVTLLLPFPSRSRAHARPAGETDVVVAVAGAIDMTLGPVSPFLPVTAMVSLPLPTVMWRAGIRDPTSELPFPSVISVSAKLFAATLPLTALLIVTSLTAFHADLRSPSGRYSRHRRR